jgi:hypothetical protein
VAVQRESKSRFQLWRARRSPQAHQARGIERRMKRARAGDFDRKKRDSGSGGTGAPGCRVVSSQTLAGPALGQIPEKRVRARLRTSLLVRSVFALVSLLLVAVPAHAVDETLGPLRGAVRLSAYNGWVVFSEPTGTGAWTLKTWHDGVIADVGVAGSDGPFDVNVGPDPSGLPTAVYSRCAGSPKADAPPADCDVFAVGLGGGAERRLGVSTSRDSEFAPAIWRDLLAFGRLSPRQRKADIFLARPGKKLRRLGPGTLPSCAQASCRRRPSKAWPRVMDVGPRAVAYRWILSGGAAFLGYGEELRIARLDGSRARLAQSGWSSGGCEGSRVFSPNVSDTSVLYGYWASACGDGPHSFQRFNVTTGRRFQAAAPGPGVLLSVAQDASDIYWLRGDFIRGECGMPDSPCELIRSRTLVFREIKGGDARPPLG